MKQGVEFSTQQGLGKVRRFELHEGIEKSAAAALHGAQAAWCERLAEKESIGEGISEDEAGRVSPLQHGPPWRVGGEEGLAGAKEGVSGLAISGEKVWQDRERRSGGRIAVVEQKGGRCSEVESSVRGC